MPPHCDSIDGPVVTAARKALDKDNVELVLPYVPKEGEEEVIRAFEKVQKVRSSDGALTREVADLYFFETVVRIHRAGEGAPFTGLKPAGLDVGPVIPVAEKAIQAGTVEELARTLCNLIDQRVRERFAEMKHLERHADEGVEQARAYVEAMLGLQVWSHKLYETDRKSTR